MPVSDQGVDPARYTIIPRTLIFLTRGDAVLLLKGDSDKTIWADKYNGVGGHIEKGEGVQQAARRELKEETGLQHQALRLVGTVTIDTGQDPGIGLYVFTGEFQGGELKPSGEGQLTWVSRDDLSRYPLVEDLSTLLPRVLEAGPGEPPFSAHYHYDEHDQLMITFDNA